MVKTLADEGLAGLKDSAFDLVTFLKFLTGVDNPGFLHIPGTEAIAAPAIQAGGDAVVSGLANGWPEIMGELWQALQNNDGREIGAAQLRVVKAREIMKSAPTLVVCYEVLHMRGVNAGYPRLPYALLSEEKRASIKKAFSEMGLKFA
jgi:N-acetylneuraminate lyase/4-hydroxy-tetrahydrodipicolinate synthase